MNQNMQSPENDPLNPEQVAHRETLHNMEILVNRGNTPGNLNRLMKEGGSGELSTDNLKLKALLDPSTDGQAKVGVFLDQSQIYGPDKEGSVMRVFLLRVEDGQHLPDGELKPDEHGEIKIGRNEMSAVGGTVQESLKATSREHLTVSIPSPREEMVLINDHSTNGTEITKIGDIKKVDFDGFQ